MTQPEEQVYKGRDEMLLSTLILDPAHSILTQSYDSRLRLVVISELRTFSSVTDILRIHGDLTTATALA